MHAVVIHANVHDVEAGVTALQQQVVPRVSQMPGVVAGYWCLVGPGKGVSMVVFESEEGAREGAQQIRPPGDFVSFESVETGEVMAHI
jgi:hypothetical protein